MKHTVFLCVFTLLKVLQAEPVNDEFISKTLNLHFESKETAKDWTLRDLSFNEWIDVVSDANWTELYKSKKEDFYYAIFRSGQYLIFCINDRGNSYFGSIYSIDFQHQGRSLARPIVSPALKWKLIYPNGTDEGQKVFAVWKILNDYHGELTVKYRAYHSENKNIKVFKKAVYWD